MVRFARRAGVRETLGGKTARCLGSSGNEDVTGPVAARVFREPRRVTSGMEWRLHELDEHRTFVETVTLCEPTDERARRRFALYWGVIRIGSGIIRHDLLRAVERRALASLSASRP